MDDMDGPKGVNKVLVIGLLLLAVMGCILAYKIHGLHQEVSAFKAEADFSVAEEGTDLEDFDPAKTIAIATCKDAGQWTSFRIVEKDGANLLAYECVDKK